MFMKIFWPQVGGVSVAVPQGNRFANESLTLRGAKLGRGNESLYKWSMSHDQNGRHGHK